MCSICFAKLAVADTPNLIQLKRPERTSEGTVKALHKIVRAIRQRFGSKVRIIVCVDSSVARERSWACPETMKCSTVLT
jgi:hypothetical protein